MFNKTAVYRHNLFLEHNPGFGHVERPERLSSIYSALENYPGRHKLAFPEITPASTKDLTLNHSIDYVLLIASTAGKARTSLDPDTSTSKRSYEAAVMAAGATIGATSSVAAGEFVNAFALVRPPGHHAEANRAMGFCLFNNVAVAAKYALNNLGIKRFLVVDWDMHHGNGTQNSFYGDDRVLYFSVHQSPCFPGTGRASETGRGKGEGFNINVPLRAGKGDAEYLKIFKELLVPVARQYQPELIIVSAGFDIAAEDPLGSMNVSRQGFAGLAGAVLTLAGETCSGKTVFVLEGGYDLNALKNGTLAVLGAMTGDRCTEDVFSETDECCFFQELEQAMEVQKKYWNI